MVSLSYDLHIHSCLSPCGDNDMTPANIVGMAHVKGLDCIALTDHNSCKNCEAFVECAKQYDIIAIPGMELTTSEEVHVVCLFPDVKSAMEWDSYVHDKIIPIQNDPAIFGQQLIMNSDDEIIGTEKTLLISATDISFYEVFKLVKKYKGVAFPAHIDKNSNSVISNLGMIPPDCDFSCVELKNKINFNALSLNDKNVKCCKVITNSDAHYLWDINEPVNFLHARSRKLKDIFNIFI